jgi:16S rRNA (uracil1498-N3)-methyltransferase
VNARFHAPQARSTGEEIVLSDEEARHLTRVLRLGAGDAVRVFDGSGHEFAARVTSVVRDTVRVRLEEACPAAREASVAITLAQAVLKGDRMDDVVRDAVMTGVAAMQPIVTTRTEVSMAALARGGRRARWERVAISSAKQCGRAVVPPVREPMDFDAFVSGLAATAAHVPIMLVEPSAGGDVVSLSALSPTAPAAATVLVGPEGGWTGDEIAAAAPVCKLLSLGGRTIRADAMALVAVAALFSRWGEY